MNKCNPDSLPKKTREKDLLDRVSNTGTSVLGLANYSFNELECAKKLSRGLESAYKKPVFQDKILFVNLEYLLEHRNFYQNQPNNKIQTHVIVIMWGENDKESDLSSYIHGNGMFKNIIFLITEHLRQVCNNCSIHFITSYREADILGTRYAQYAEIKQGIEDCKEVRSQVTETDEDIFKYLLASHSLINYKGKHILAKEYTVKYPIDRMNQIPVKIEQLIKSLFLTKETNVSPRASSQEDSYILIVPCCSNNCTVEFLSDIELIKDVKSTPPAFLNSFVEPKKNAKKSKIFIKNDCIVSGLNKNYIFFRRSSDNMPFSLSKENFIAKVIFEYGEFFYRGDYIGDGLDSFVQCFNSKNEVDSRFDGICGRSFRADFYKDLASMKNKELTILLLTESSDERWVKFAESWRLSLLQVLCNKKMKQHVTELNFNKGDFETQERGIEITQFEANDMKKSVHGIDYNKNKLNIVEQINSILNIRIASNIILYR